METEQSETRYRRFWTALASLVAAGCLAGFFLAVHDIAALEPREPEDFEAAARLLRRLLALGLLLGLVLPVLKLVLLAIDGLGRGRPGRALTIAALLGAAAAFPLLGGLSQSLLSGQGISRWSLIDLARKVGPFVLVLLAFLGLRLGLGLGARIRRSRPLARAAAALLILALAVVVVEADARLYRGLYADLHLILAGSSLLLAAWGMTLLLGLGGRFTVLPALGVIALSLGAVAFEYRAPLAPATRFIFARRSLQGERLIEIWRGLEIEGEVEAEAVVYDADFAAARRDRGLRAESLRQALRLELGEKRPRHLIWITVDTLRRDALGFMGAGRPVSPNLDALAAESLVFARHWAQFPLTSYSFQSIFSGRYPSASNLYRMVKKLPDDPAGDVTLAERLGREGFRTVAIPAIPTASLDHPIYRLLGRGFDEIAPGAPTPRNFLAEEQVDMALEVLSEPQERPLFLWLHLMDPHYDYIVHPGHAFGPKGRDRYDAEVSYTDQELGRLFDRLRSSGILDDAVLVFHSDHGEAFQEHDTSFHGTTLYEEQIAVPCLIRYPGRPARRVNEPSGNVDLMATALDLLGLAPAAVDQGQSLAGQLLDRPIPELLPVPFAYAEIPDAIEEMAPSSRDRRAIVSDRYKLIENRRAGFSELYDLVADPTESFNIASRRPELVARYRAMIEVIDRECATINVPVDLRDDEAHYAALREELATGPVPNRVRLLEENVEGDDPRLKPILLDRLADPAEHELVKLAIVDLGAAVLGLDALPALRGLIAGGLSLGTRATALEIWRREGLPLESGDADLLAQTLASDAQVAWRAARLLADHGDARALLVLEPALGLGDRRTRFLSACALGRLGRGEAAETLREGLVRASAEPELLAEALEALVRIDDAEAYRTVLALSRGLYLHHLVKEGALRYFEAQSPTRALLGFIQLGNGWDAAIGKRIRETLEARLGPERARAIMEVAATRGEIFDLARESSGDEAIVRCRAARELLEDSSADILFRLVEERLLREAGRRTEAEELAARGVPAELPEAWKRYAAALAAFDPGAVQVIEVRALEAIVPMPLRAGQEASFLLRLANVGPGVIPGGTSTRAPRIRLTIEDPAGPSGQGFESFLPEPGLAPGDEVEIVVKTSVHGPARTRSRLRIARGDDGELEVRDPEAATRGLSLADATAGGLEVDDLTMDGRAILEGWLPLPSLRSGVLMPDGAVAYLGRTLDPSLIGPLLADCGGPIEVELSFRASSTAAERRDTLELFWRYPGQEHFLGHQRAVDDCLLDGERRTLRFRIEPQGGHSPAQIRFDFFQLPELAIVDAIRIRRL